MANFQLQQDGVWVYDGNGQKKICSRLEVKARVRDQGSDNWGRLLEWDDSDKKPHKWVMYESALAASNKPVLATLLAGGLAIEPGCQQSVIDYIHSVQPIKRVTIVQQTGWHGDAFVLPDTVIQPSASNCEFVFAPATGPAEHNYRVRGSADEWKHNVGVPCSGNGRAVFAVSLALAAPTIGPLGEEGGGAHLHSASSLGKSTILEAAGSVWGGGGKDGYAQSWRTTSNGLELLGAAHHDCFLALDELGQLEPKDAISAAYTLAGGKSKKRMKADGSGQHQKPWRTLFLSSGEITIDELAARVGDKTRGGMEVRMINIPADAEKELGAWENLHGVANGAKFSDALRKAAGTYYGAVGRVWLQRLVENGRDVFVPILGDYISDFEEKYKPSAASAEVGRVVHRFAVIAAAGELATEEGLTGWELGEASRGVAACLAAWLDRRGGARQGHDTQQIIRQVRLFIERHGESRFRKLGEKALDGSYNEPIHDMAGYFRLEEGGTVYYFQRETFQSEVCIGFNYKEVLTALKNASHLLADAGPRMMKQIGILPKHPRFYAVKDSILLTNDDGYGE